MRTKKRITDIQTAVDLYFSTDRLSNKDIMKLFDCCEGTAANLKKAAKEQEAQDGKMSPSTTTVNTVSAFKAWGVNIKDLVKRLEQYKKIKGVTT